jgi:hypothetical protein
MTILNYALSGGNKTLLRAQAIDRDMVFQLWYTDLTAATITVEIWASTNASQPFAKIPAATKTLVPADGTALISLSGLSYVFVEFRVIAPAGTLGTITTVDVLNAINLS